MTEAAVRLLVTAIWEQHPEHTSGAGIAQADADIVDVVVDYMSDMASQPIMAALVASLQGALRREHSRDLLSTPQRCVQATRMCTLMKFLVEIHVHPKAKKELKCEVGAPMPDDVIDIRVKVVKRPLIVLSAMKMEMMAQSSVSGVVK
ncbi:pyruvate carboxylase, mitochondrial-like [Drosophila albomicans]|uniref:Pyruvate carboxylase, mitochondrial-like n=1 Tax=Drosophila albomicans TaxID=7291 RepID=A0A9C6T8K7_DROAB|nr:pyruvate carboxylase, mitochondrial-like [Drosophila albomicans]